MSALCHRKLQNFDKSKSAFSVINQELKRKQREAIKKTIFTALLLPFQVDRNTVLDHLNTTKQVMDFYSRFATSQQPSKTMNRSQRRSLLFRGGSGMMKKASTRYEKKMTRGISLYENEKEFWEVGANLQKISFFCRFTVDQLESEVIPKLEVKDFEEDEVIFIQAQEVAIVMEGAVLMRSHRESITTPQLISKFGNQRKQCLVAGDIIGASELENSISRQHENWFTVHREAKVAFVTPDNFAKIWSLQKKTEKELFKSLISTHQFFKCLCPQTIYLLSYELLEVRKYCPGDMVALMSKVSPYNLQYQELFVNQISEISLNLKRQERKRLKVDRDSPELNMTLTSQTHFSARSGNNSHIKISTQQLNQGRTFKGSQKMSFISINDGNRLELKEPTLKGKITEYVDQESVDQSPKSRSRVKQHIMSSKSILSGSTSFNGSGVELEGEIEGLDLIEEEEEMQFERGLFIVNKGKAVVRDPYDGFEVAELRRGQFFKQEDYLHVKGFAHFGNIFAEEGEEVLECLYLSGVHLKRLPIWEVEKLREFAESRNSIQKISYTCELRAGRRKK